jgi:hypothetical protein
VRTDEQLLVPRSSRSFRMSTCRGVMTAGPTRPRRAARRRSPALPNSRTSLDSPFGVASALRPTPASGTTEPTPEFELRRARIARRQTDNYIGKLPHAQDRQTG